mmetsp:Transcript_30788/g.73142  ORF Transcript_30788/g.73142 Transcript_30788/m.73142 type:complete len:270 (+) Transcript_30788:393-1202(+)
MGRWGGSRMVRRLLLMRRRLVLKRRSTSHHFPALRSRMGRRLLPMRPSLLLTWRPSIWSSMGLSMGRRIGQHRSRMGRPCLLLPASPLDGRRAAPRPAHRGPSSCAHPARPTPTWCGGPAARPAAPSPSSWDRRARGGTAALRAPWAPSSCRCRAVRPTRARASCRRLAGPRATRAPPSSALPPPRTPTSCGGHSRTSWGRGVQRARPGPRLRRVSEGLKSSLPSTSPWRKTTTIPSRHGRTTKRRATFSSATSRISGRRGIACITPTT